MYTSNVYDLQEQQNTYSNKGGFITILLQFVQGKIRHRQCSASLNL